MSLCGHSTSIMALLVLTNHSAAQWFFIGVFNPFIFKVIINREVLLLVCSLFPVCFVVPLLKFFSLAVYVCVVYFCCCNNVISFSFSFEDLLYMYIFVCHEAYIKLLIFSVHDTWRSLNKTHHILLFFLLLIRWVFPDLKTMLRICHTAVQTPFFLDCFWDLGAWCGSDFQLYPCPTWGLSYSLTPQRYWSDSYQPQEFSKASLFTFLIYHKWMKLQ